MAISISSMRRGSDPTVPPILQIYGPHGIGKTTLAAGAPDPVFAMFEEGLGVLDAANFGLLKAFSELMEVIGALGFDDHDRKTLCLDSLDWLERIVWQETCDRNNWKDIEAADYGKGYTAAMDVWRDVLSGFNMLRNERKMGIILLAHASIRNFKSPETEPYDRYTPKLHESNKGIGANPLLQEAVDCVFFMNWRTSVVTDKTSNNKKDVGHKRGVGGGQRMLYTEERPAFLAKNRYGMPDSIALPDDPSQSWGAVAQHIPFYARQMDG